MLGFPNQTGIGTDGIDKDLLLRMPKEGMRELTVMANIMINEGVLPCKATESIIVLLPKPGGARGRLVSWARFIEFSQDSSRGA